MGDELRNNFFDKYYKKISKTTTKSDPSTGYESAHYLRNWYTSWGGALDGSWAWQIGCSHAHEFYQNPLAAYALLADSDLNSAMKAENATEDYKTSLQRQLEFYLWLQSANGPIAGGATNSLHGRYEDYSNGYTYTADPDSNGNPRGDSNKLITSTFYDMIYLEHPVYEDPGSNHWIGNQVWALQRIAELYYDVAQLGDKSGVTVAGMSVEDACAQIMDRWVEWSLENIKFDDEAVSTLEKFSGTTFTGDKTKAWAIPSSLIWHGQPETWTGSVQQNSDLTCEIEGYGQEVGSTASWANGLIYYAAAKGVDTNTTKTADELIASSDVGEKALGYAKKMIDYQWATCRDDIGLTMVDTNSNLTRFFEQSVYIPTSYSGTMPNGDKIENGATFFSLRTSYENDPDYARLKEGYDSGNVGDVTWTYHRFWHEGDALMANGVMATLFPNLTPDPTSENPVEDDVKFKDDSIEIEVGENKKLDFTGDASDFTSSDDSIAKVDSKGNVTGVKPGTATITVTGKNGSTDTITVTVTETTTETTVTTEATTTSTSNTTEATTTSTSSVPDDDIVWGDINCDGNVKSNDLLLLKKYLIGLAEAPTDFPEQGLKNVDVTHDGNVKSNDLLKLKKYLLGLIDDLGPNSAN